VKPRVFLTRELPPEPMRVLRQETDLSVNPEDRVLTRAELIDGLRGQDGLLCLLTDTIDRDVLDAAPGLRIVANYAVGINNVDVDAATERGIPVTNTPDVLTDTTADMAFTLLLAAARRLVEGHDLVRSRTWRGWGPLQLLGSEVSGATLGLIGIGRIARAMIPRAHGFGMEVLYWNRRRLEGAEEERLGVRYAAFEDLLERSRFVSIHVAYTPDTHHLIDASALERLGEDGYLINTARGPVVDERALVGALERRAIAGAGLDVFEREPLLEDALYDLPNATLAPHLGSATLETRTAMGMKAVRNLLAGLGGQRPPDLVNPSAWRAEG
jgi:glyoxylate reductase